MKTVEEILSAFADHDEPYLVELVRAAQRDGWNARGLADQETVERHFKTSQGRGAVRAIGRVRFPGDLVPEPACLNERLDDEPITDADAQDTVRRLGIDVPTWAAEIRSRVAEAMAPPFVECAYCAAKSGWPVLCDDCLRRRGETKGEF